LVDREITTHYISLKHTIPDREKIARVQKFAEFFTRIVSFVTRLCAKKWCIHTSLLDDQQIALWQ
jgi:hypothetical protein